MSDSGNGDKGPTRPKILPVSRINSGGQSKFRSAKCFQEIDRRIRLGWSTSDLVVAIHEEFNECTDVKDGYLKKLVDDYRRTIPPSELVGAAVNSAVARNATRTLVDGLNEIQELERLYRLQAERLEMAWANEKKFNMTFPNTGKEVFVAMKIVKQSADLKMDLGLLRRQIGTVEVTGRLAADATERYGKDFIGKVIADPDSRHKVLFLAERLMNLTARASIDAVGVIGEAIQAERAAENADEDVIDVIPVDIPLIGDGESNDD